MRCRSILFSVGVGFVWLARQSVSSEDSATPLELPFSGSPPELLIAAIEGGDRGVISARMLDTKATQRRSERLLKKTMYREQNNANDNKTTRKCSNT